MFLLWGKHINKYYLRYLIFFLLGIAALVTVDWYQLKIPEILGQVVQHLKDDGTIDIYGAYFHDMMIEVVIVAVILLIGRVLWRLTLFFASKKIEENLRNEMMKKASELDVNYYHQNSVGNIMSWATNDIETIEEFMGWGSLMMIDGVFLTVFALIKMHILSTTLALISLVPILLIAISGAICNKFMSERWRLRQESNDALYDFSRESFTGIRVIKAFTKEIQQIHAFAKIAKHNETVNVKFTQTAVIFDVSLEVIIGLVVAIILGFGGWFIYATVVNDPVVIFGYAVYLKPGELITFFGYFSSLIWPMIALGHVVSSFSKARTSYKRIAHFLDTPIDIKDSEDAIEKEIMGKITFNHFSFTYPNNKKEVISDINLEIKKGETIGVVGMVGSGKSTLINSLLHLYNVNKGQIFIDDTDIMDISLSSLRSGVSIAPQDNFIFSGKLSENIAFSSEDIIQEKVIDSSVFADVKKDIEEFPDKFETVIGENGQTVSGGQRQRISLARAFYKDSPILILDDVVSAVDLKTEQVILSNIKKERAGKTTIIVASRVSTVMNVDRVIVLNKGQLEAFASPKELLKTSHTFSRMAFLQNITSKEVNK